ncbi:Rieske 2Fe-2S domain-containing protein [Paracrocinitomix mangrovi]|uniref:Rieske 2Fe-2S domain-containing protein n=1 Tax=Paracrocinitomix mangrovi TaxID=2862509 RepID=UPI001C8D7348|nr:Rieske 2Fe-2S domain-containing protein [Paracrocinitomix mangrovi]UKN03569.1 Rieske 2Fe-2S domain-containing protein [Paracrocinitomix mangrovi]
MPQIYSRFAIISSFTLALFLTSCDSETHPVPNVPVNININLDLPSNQSLNAPGGWIYVNGGSRGIVVYRNFDEFVALDRHCTYHSEDACGVVEVDSVNYFELTCPCGSSRYSIMSGVVMEGPAKFGLRRYNATWDGAYNVNIYN